MTETLNKTKINPVKVVKLFFAATIFLLLSCGAASTSQSAAIAPELLRDVIWSKNYSVYVNQVKPAQTNVMKNTQSVRTFDDPKAQYIKLTPDFIDVYLPYFGDAQLTDATNADFKFRSKYSYDSKVDSHGNWTVTVIPENTTGVQEMIIEVNKSGTAFITVNSSRRSPVGYNGFIEN